jgi:hypothetical protein
VIAQPYFRALLAEAYGKSGAVKKGLQCLDEAFAAVRDPTRYIYAPELYRIRGELLQRTRNPPQTSGETAARCFQQALRITRRHGARLFELRTLISQSHGSARQEQQGAVRQQLAAAYRRFHEGADTADVRTAQALLANCL